MMSDISLNQHKGRFSVSCGWGSPTMQEQLSKWGACDHPDVEKWEKIRFSISMLSVHGILTQSERDRALNRFAKMVEVKLVEDEYLILAGDE